MRLLADENFHGDVLRGLLRVEPKLDIVRVQDTHLYQAADPVILEWAAKEDRVLLTHDVETMMKHAYDRIRAGLPMPGVTEVRDDLPIGQAIEEILTALFASQPGELANRITYIPFYRLLHVSASLLELLVEADFGSQAHPHLATDTLAA
jgi:hypothetical protein